jgi:hypothetical protein
MSAMRRNGFFVVNREIIVVGFPAAWQNGKENDGIQNQEMLLLRLKKISETGARSLLKQKFTSLILLFL